MSRDILVGVTLGGDHTAFVGREQKPSYPLLSVIGWMDRKGVTVSWSWGSETIEGGDSEAFSKALYDHAKSMYHSMRWFEECTVMDATPDQELPDEIFVMVRSYQNEGSWYAKEAFLSREKAEELAKRNSYEWYWAIPCRRFVAPVPKEG